MKKYIEFIEQFQKIKGFVRVAVNHLETSSMRMVYHPDDISLKHIAAYSIGGSTLSFDVREDSKEGVYIGYSMDDAKGVHLKYYAVVASEDTEF